MTEPKQSGADLVWDENGQPFSSQFGDVYFSKASGIDESRYVFLQQNRLAERWSELAAHAHFSIGETGFGTGLNFLVAWALWRQCAPAGARLHFVSVEKHPLSRTQLQQALQLWPELAELAQSLCDSYPPMPARGFHRMSLDGGRVQLTLIFEDAVAGLQQLLPVIQPSPRMAALQPTWAGRPISFDAWFLDGFAPAKNPDMWNSKLFNTLSRLSAPGTSFATFTAAGVVKQGLRDAGFSIEKVPGFGRKRHMLRGEWADIPAKQVGQQSKAFDTPWHLTDQQAALRRQPHVAIVGAGLAGCHSARALAERGFHVTVVEQQGIASGASGNPQGVVYAKASSQDQPLTRFNLTALQFACRYYQTQVGYGQCGSATGVVHLAQDEKQAAEYRAVAERYRNEPDFVQWVARSDSAALCGIPLSHDGLLFPQAGWLNPGDLCRRLLEHPKITYLQRKVARLEFADDQWSLLDIKGGEIATAPYAIIANANEARHFEQTACLPLKPVRGQITAIRATETSAQLRRVLCGRGYIAPETQGQHCLGASFNLKEQSTAANPADDADNLAHVAELSQELLPPQTEVHFSRVSFRCTTPDYLPLVGPVPVHHAFDERFHGFRYNARASIDEIGSYYPGLFANLGHGSRGLVYTPLCAELLASMIAGEPLPLETDMAIRLHPARFLIRDLKRNRA